MSKASDRYEIHVRGPATNGELNDLHTAAFGGPSDQEWTARLHRHSLTWVIARCGEQLVGFVNVVGDGGLHAFVLDTMVHPQHQGLGLGRRLVRAAAGEARELGCDWLHADYERRYRGFYEQGCGLRATSAGLLRL